MVALDNYTDISVIPLTPDADFCLSKSNVSLALAAHVWTSLRRERTVLTGPGHVVALPTLQYISMCIWLSNASHCKPGTSNVRAACILSSSPRTRIQAQIRVDSSMHAMTLRRSSPIAKTFQVCERRVGRQFEDNKAQWQLIHFQPTAYGKTIVLRSTSPRLSLGLSIPSKGHSTVRVSSTSTNRSHRPPYSLLPSPASQSA